MPGQLHSNSNLNWKSLTFRIFPNPNLWGKNYVILSVWNIKIVYKSLAYLFLCYLFVQTVHEMKCVWWILMDWIQTFEVCKLSAWWFLTFLSSLQFLKKLLFHSFSFGTWAVLRSASLSRHTWCECLHSSPSLCDLWTGICVLHKHAFISVVFDAVIYSMFCVYAHAFSVEKKKRMLIVLFLQEVLWLLCCCHYC